MKYDKVLSRRTLLRGAGTVAIGLPFLAAMSRRSDGRADDGGSAPMRCMTLFFGLGVPKAMQQLGLDDDASPLSPLRPHQGKVTLLTDVDMSAPAATLAPHLWGGLMSATGRRPRSVDLAGGASVEQFVKRALYPRGVPTRLDTLAAGFFLDQRDWPHFRCRDSFGAPAAEPYNQPARLFEAIFGAPPGAGADDRERRARRSVLDTVREQYRHYLEDRGDVGVESRLRLEQHLDQIRQLERRVYEEIPAACASTPRPTQPDLPYDLQNGLDGHEVTLDEVEQVFSTLTELSLVAMRCDLVRFGNLMFEPPAPHTRFVGTYRSGSYTHVFDGSTSHHDYHALDEARMRGFSHLAMQQMASVLAAMDDDRFPEEGGGTLLDHTAVLISTEVGTNHDHDGVFHAIAGRGECLRLGGSIGGRVHAADVYDAFVRALGVDETMADPTMRTTDLEALVAV